MLCWRVSNTQSSMFQHQRWVDDRPRSCYKQAMEPFCDIQRYSWALASRSLTRRSTRDSQYKRRKKGSRNAVFFFFKTWTAASKRQRTRQRREAERRKKSDRSCCLLLVCWTFETRYLISCFTRDISLSRVESLGSRLACSSDLGSATIALAVCAVAAVAQNTQNGAVPLRLLIDFEFSTSPYLTLIEYVFHIITIQFRWCWWKGMTTTMSTDRMKNEKKRKHFICDSAKAFWLWPLPRNRRNISRFLSFFNSKYFLCSTKHDSWINYFISRERIAGGLKGLVKGLESHFYSLNS